MKMRNIPLPSFLTHWLIVFAVVANVSLSQAADADRPSVLFLNIDDWNDWNEVLEGHPQAITPNLKRLAERGMTLPNG